MAKLVNGNAKASRETLRLLKLNAQAPLVIVIKGMRHTFNLFYVECETKSCLKIRHTNLPLQRQ